jgi:hypothetical protein
MLGPAAKADPVLEVGGGDQGVPLAMHECAQRLHSFGEVLLQGIPRPTREGLQRTDLLGGELVLSVAPATPANPDAEREIAFAVGQ